MPHIHCSIIVNGNKNVLVINETTLFQWYVFQTDRVILLILQRNIRYFQYNPRTVTPVIKATSRNNAYYEMFTINTANTYRMNFETYESAALC